VEMPMKPLIIREIKGFLKNPAFIASLVILFVFYGALGSIMRSGIESAIKESQSLSVGIVKEEETPLVAELIKVMNQYTNGSIGIYDSLEEAVDKIGVAIVIPKGFTENATTPGKPIVLKGGIRIDSLSPISSQTRLSLLSTIASMISNLLPVAISKLYNVSIEPSKQVSIDSYVRVYDKNLSINEFNAFTGLFSILPFLISIIVGINAGYAAQATAIEKVEKAFEMLLAQPIPRRNVVLAKILGAVVASVIMGITYMAAMLFMVLSINPSIQAGTSATSEMTRALVDVMGVGNIVSIVLTLVLGLIYSGAIGVIIGALVSDERIAGVLTTPVILLFMGLGFAIMYGGIPLNLATAVLSGIAITPIPYILLSATLSGQSILITISILVAIATTALLLFTAIVVFNRDTVILGLRISVRRRS